MRHTSILSKYTANDNVHNAAVPTACSDVRVDCLTTLHYTLALKQKVLVPGAGLGRLVLEICACGYAAEGNEFSYQMLFVSNYMLNHVDTEVAEANVSAQQGSSGGGSDGNSAGDGDGGSSSGGTAICPFIDTMCNHVGSEDMAR